MVVSSSVPTSAGRWKFEGGGRRAAEGMEEMIMMQKRERGEKERKKENVIRTD